MASTTNTTRINDLPIKMQLMILENISLHELVVNSSKVCFQWQETIAHFIMGPKLLRLANVNGKFKRDIKEDGWTEEAQESDFILSLYPKYQFFSSEVYSSK